MQDQRTQNYLFMSVPLMLVRDSFIKFWIKSEMEVEKLVITRSTIVYGKGNVPGLSKCKVFTVRESHIKNPEFVFKPLSSSIKEMHLTGNDFYGVMSFNIVYHIGHHYDKFENLSVLEFEGQIEEPSLIYLLSNLQKYPSLKTIKLTSKGTFFNIY
jgi:hypothetical protein